MSLCRCHEYNGTAHPDEKKTRADLLKKIRDLEGTIEGLRDIVDMQRRHYDQMYQAAHAQATRADALAEVLKDKLMIQ